MKKTQRKDLISIIKKTFISFISIIIFISLGVSIFIGLDYSGNALKESLNNEFKKGNMHDLAISFPYGVKQQEVDEFKTIEGVDYAEGQQNVYEFFKYNDDLKQAKIVNFTNEINKIISFEGRLPTSINEIAVEKGTANALDIKIGDKIILENQNAASSYYLKLIKENPELTYNDILNMDEGEYCYLLSDELIVTAIVVSPEYLNISMSSYGVSLINSLQVDGIFYVNYESFNSNVVSGYNCILLKNNELDNIYCFSDEYEKLIKELKDRIGNKVNTIGRESYLKVKNNGDNFIDFFNNTLLESKDEIEQGQLQIADKQIEIEESIRLIEENRIILAENENLLISANEELIKAEKEITNARKKLNQYWKEYEENLAEFENAKTKYNKSYNTVLSATGRIISGLAVGNESQIRQYIKNELNNDINILFDEENVDNLFNYENAQELYSKVINLKKVYLELDLSEERALNEIQLNIADFIYEYGQVLVYSYAGYQTICADVSNSLDEAKSDLDIYEEQYNEQNQLYLDSKKEYSNKLEELNAGKEALSQAEKEIEEAQSLLEEAQKKISDAIEKYNESKSGYDKILVNQEIARDYENNILSQNNNVCYIYIELLSNIIIRMKYCLGGVFLLLSILVCYSVIIRIINDQKILIGTKKALGMNEKEIKRLYYYYTGISVFIGSIIGFVLATFVYEPILVNNVCLTYNFVPQTDYINWILAIGLFVGLFILVRLVTYLGCRKVLKFDAVTLLQGEQVGIGKQRFYERLSIFDNMYVYYKTIINNLLKDASRVFATLIGIAGCTALIVSCITLKNNVLESFKIQYDDYFHFDNMIFFDNQIDDAQENIASVLDEYDIPYALVYRSNGYTYNDDYEKKLTTLFVYGDTSSFKKIISLKSVSQNAFKYSGFWLSQSIMEEYKLDDNCEIIYESFTGEKLDQYITGFYKIYSYHLTAFVDGDTYSKLTGNEIKNNTFIVDTSKVDMEDVLPLLRNIKGYTQFHEYYAIDRESARVFELLAKAIVGIYLFASIIMSFFVILNLLLTFISEKKNELIIMMINGFSLKSAKNYIIYDSILLTIFGIIIGVLFGIVVGDLCISSFESEYLYLLHTPNLWAIIIAIIVTSILSILMTLLSIRKIKNFDLTDINVI